MKLTHRSPTTLAFRRGFSDRLLGGWLVLLASATCPLMAQPGTTVVTHGFQLDGLLPDWPTNMGVAIAQVFQPSAPTGTVLVYDPISGAWVPVFGPEDPGGELILVFDWADDSSWLPGDDDRKGTAHGAAAALYAALRAPRVSGALAGSQVLTRANGSLRRLHFIGHSRGTCVNSEAVRRLVTAGFPVDQVTTLDPHPAGPSADLLDPQPMTWLGVTWADNYFRTDGCDIDYGCFGFDFDGQSVAGAANADLGLDAFGFIDNRLNSCSLEHSLTHTWYHGTINLAAANDGTCTIARADWYVAGGAGEGYAFSQAAATATRACGPGGGCIDAGRTPATPTASIVNGDFEFGPFQDAGWRWHGGGGSGLIIDEPGNAFLTLDSAGSTRTHSRFFLDPTAIGIHYDLRIFASDPTTALEVTLREAGSTVDHLLESVPVAATAPWNRRTVDLAGIPKGKLYTLTVALTSASSMAIVDLDDFDLELGGGPRFLRGDCNNDGTVNVADAVSALSALFGTGSMPACLAGCDANDDGQFDIADAVTTLLALFAIAMPLPPPNPACGVDPTLDSLSCANSSCP